MDDETRAREVAAKCNGLKGAGGPFWEKHIAGVIATALAEVRREYEPYVHITNEGIVVTRDTDTDEWWYGQVFEMPDDLEGPFTTFEDAVAAAGTEPTGESTMPVQPQPEAPRSASMTNHLHGITQQLYRLESLNEDLSSIRSRVRFFTTGDSGVLPDEDCGGDKQSTLSLYAIQENLMHVLDRAEETIKQLNESLGDGDLRKKNDPDSE